MKHYTQLINTELVARLMRETAKECGMTRLSSSADRVWLSEFRRVDPTGDTNRDSFRRITRRYDVVTNNFLDLLECKVKAERFTLANCNVKVKLALGIPRKREYDNAVYADRKYLEACEKATEIYEKIASTYLERRPELKKYNPDYFTIVSTYAELGKFLPLHFWEADRFVANLHPNLSPLHISEWESLVEEERKEIQNAQNELKSIYYSIQPEVPHCRYSYVTDDGKSTIGDTYVRLTARIKN